MLEKNLSILEDICGFPRIGVYELFEGYIGSAAASYREEMEQSVESLKNKYCELKINYIYMENLQKAYLLVQGNRDEASLKTFEKSFYNRMILTYQNKEERAIWTKKQFQRLEELKTTVLELDRLLSYALVLKNREWLTAEDVEAYQPVPFESPAEIYNRIRNAICQGDKEGLKKGGEAFLIYMQQGHFEVEDIRRAFVKSYYLIGDTLQEIDRSLYNHLKASNLLRNIESAVTWHELENAYRDVIQVITGAKVKREDISNYIIKRAINYIREHYQEGITQEEVSRELEITPEYLSTLFNREMGINFSTFLKQFRMSHAKRLLKGTDMKIYEIAKAAGYSDPKYFQRVFKEEIGVSPGEYRQMN
ncbi:AraC family transcriptional regulator [Faecalicatena sp. AGMB00832]|uniref:AraC family transcriptional regulator n=1 Tax=Faecalicatena faecalis TaxID=2726362 RepID=A0ABS6DB76_9FIRM|nr:AraC family transcriptional regulator [Faecalicatena faecalis]MBU3878776.1 AraC family transcriptional regulator [Faecalicatena faecalis]